MGERSKVPPSGGMMPLNRLRYGSQIVLHHTVSFWFRASYRRRWIAAVSARTLEVLQWLQEGLGTM